MASVRPRAAGANTRQHKLAELHELAVTAGNYIGLTGHRRERRKINRTWKLDMSDHGELTYSIAEGMDYPAHEETYKSFIKLGTIGAAVVVTVVVLLAIFLL